MKTKKTQRQKARPAQRSARKNLNSDQHGRPVRVGSIIGAQDQVGVVEYVDGGALVMRALGDDRDWTPQTQEEKQGWQCREVTVLLDPGETQVMGSLTAVTREAVALAARLAVIGDEIGLAATSTNGEEADALDKAAEKIFDVIAALMRVATEGLSPVPLCCGDFAEAIGDQSARFSGDVVIKQEGRQP
jgi:hypothetical protein